MELKYVGPKPIISHHGIEFDNNKEDKFAYLNIAVQLLKALDHSYFEDKKYVYEASSLRFDNDELMRILRHYCQDLDILMEKGTHNIKEEIEHNIERAHENSVLNKVNKEILENNILIMQDYLVQRSVNKSVYYCAIDALAELLKRDHIDYIIVPMYQKFTHVLHSIQGSLRRQKSPIDTQIDIYQENGQLLSKLKVVNN